MTFNHGFYSPKRMALGIGYDVRCADRGYKIFWFSFFNFHFRIETGSD